MSSMRIQALAFSILCIGVGMLDITKFLYCGSYWFHPIFAFFMSIVGAIIFTVVMYAIHFDKQVNKRNPNNKQGGKDDDTARIYLWKTSI